MPLQGTSISVLSRGWSDIAGRVSAVTSFQNSLWLIAMGWELPVVLKKR
jgi:hypothetical protein